MDDDPKEAEEESTVWGRGGYHGGDNVDYEVQV